MTRVDLNRYLLLTPAMFTFKKKEKQCSGMQKRIVCEWPLRGYSHRTRLVFAFKNMRRRASGMKKIDGLEMSFLEVEL